MRWSNTKPTATYADILIALKLIPETGFQEVYNGKFPAHLLRGRKDSSNGQLSLSVSALLPINPKLLARSQCLAMLNELFTDLNR